jgi:hypothetical protein
MRCPEQGMASSVQYNVGAGTRGHIVLEAKV